MTTMAPSRTSAAPDIPIDDTYTLAELIEPVVALMRRGKSVMLWGHPGVGKTDWANQLAYDILHWDLYGTRAALEEPSELKFHMVPTGTALEFHPPHITTVTKPTIWLLDELNRGTEMVLNALLQPALDHMLGELVVPACVSILACCNYKGQGVRQLDPAMLSRFVHFDVRVDLDAWCIWAYAHGIDPLLVAFHRFRRDMLHRYDPDDRRARSFPCPRTWEGVDGVIKDQLSPAAEFAAMVGYVGHGAAIECSAFLSMYRGLPSIDGIMLDPDGYDIPLDPQVQWATAAALAQAITPQNFRRVVRYLERLPEEYNYFAVTAARSRDASIEQEPEFTQWFMAHGQ